jgi:hypothetical protein
MEQGRPAIWLLISSPLINMLRTKGFGFQSSNLLADESYTFVCYTYVDDTDLVHNRMDTNPNQIIPDMQRMLNHWAGGLRATGGALVPARSYWYGIDFKWNKKKLDSEYKSITELPGSLILRDNLQFINLNHQKHQHWALNGVFLLNPPYMFPFVCVKQWSEVCGRCSGF